MTAWLLIMSFAGWLAGFAIGDQFERRWLGGLIGGTWMIWIPPFLWAVLKPGRWLVDLLFGGWLARGLEWWWDYWGFEQ